MNKPIKYRSFSVNPFNVWRIFFLVFIIPSIVFGVMLLQPDKIIYIAVLAFIVLLIFIVQSYSVVSYDGQNVKVRSLYKSLKLSNLKNIQTWWSYEIGASTPEMKEHKKEMKTHINKMNSFIEFMSEDKSIFIYDQIHMGNKFPHNHEYSDILDVDKSKLVKIWDIDNCLKKLNLDLENLLLKIEEKV